MKLTCDSCSAKYSIADDRVAGKVFKIRCKKCSHVIIVRGVTAAPEPVVAAPAPSGEWHAVVDGEQIGPFDRAELARRRDAGELDAETYVWREGMPDWVALGTLDDDVLVQPKPEPTVEMGDAMRLRNERNETSVLFTLGNLARLAAPAARAPATTSTGSAPTEEGSGLIDIRALASTWTQSSAIAKPASSTGSIDDLPAYAPINVVDPIVLVPAHHRGGDRRLLVALVAMLAMIATLATILVVVLTRDGGTAQAAVSPAPAVVKVDEPAPEAPVKIEAPAKVEPAPVPVEPAPVQVDPTPPPKARTRSRATTPPPAKPTPVPAALATPKPEQCTDVSCEYSNFAEKCCDKFKPRNTSSSSTTSDLPDNLDRTALTAGIATIKAQKCGASSSAKGDVSVSVKVTPEGGVASVTVKSTPDQALGACVVAEAKRGTFAKTKRGVKFSYVWRF